MSIKNHPEFKAEFPEQFNWGLVDSIKLSALGDMLAKRIKFELGLKPDARVHVAGLRLALLHIAEIANS